MTSKLDTHKETSYASQIYKWKPFLWDKEISPSLSTSQNYVLFGTGWTISDQILSALVKQIVLAKSLPPLSRENKKTKPCNFYVV